MEIYLLRHGEAVEIGEEGVTTDADRHLTPAGRERCRQAAAGLAWLVEQWDDVWSSPLARARQTAELVVPDAAITIESSLAGYPVEDVLGRLGKLPADSSVLLVGHLPQLPQIVERLLGARTGHLEMKKGGLVHVSVDLARWPAQPAVLRAALSPKQLRRLGG